MTWILAFGACWPPPAPAAAVAPLQSIVAAADWLRVAPEWARKLASKTTSGGCADVARRREVEAVGPAGEGEREVGDRDVGEPVEDHDVAAVGGDAERALELQRQRPAQVDTDVGEPGRGAASTSATVPVSGCDCSGEPATALPTIVSAAGSCRPGRRRPCRCWSGSRSLPPMFVGQRSPARGAAPPPRSSARSSCSDSTALVDRPVRLIAGAELGRERERGAVDRVEAGRAAGRLRRRRRRRRSRPCAASHDVGLRMKPCGGSPASPLRVRATPRMSIVAGMPRIDDRVREVAEHGVEAEVALAQARGGLQDDLRAACRAEDRPGIGDASSTIPKRAGSPARGTTLKRSPRDRLVDREEAEDVKRDVVADVADVACGRTGVGVELVLGARGGRERVADQARRQVDRQVLQIAAGIRDLRGRS